MNIAIPFMQRLGFLFKPNKYLDLIAQQSLIYNELTNSFQEQSQDLSFTQKNLESTEQALRSLQENFGKKESELSATKQSLIELKAKYQEQSSTLKATQKNLESTEQTLYSLQENYEKKESELSTTKQSLAELKAKYQEQSSTLKTTQNNLESTEQTLRSLQENYNNTERELSSSKQSLNKLREQYKEQSSFLKSTKMDLEKTENALRSLQENYNQKERELSTTTQDLTKIKAQYEDQTVSLEVTQQNLGSRIEQAKLVQKILSTPPETIEVFEKIRTFINKDFLNFADNETSLADEASVTLKLKSLEKDLEEIVYFRKTAVKTIGAIGGGFSSGKSSFINSFLHEDIQLSTDVNPTTAIPAFVIQGHDSKIHGITQKGGVFEVGVKTYQKFSHQYLKDFGFDLKDVMPVLAIEAKFKKDYFEHICIIDTPGYDPAGHETENSDKLTAQEQMHNAQFILWTIGLDTNGTIPQSDIEFLEELNLEDKELFIILNKADLKSHSDIEDIIEVVEETLEDADIEFSGISAYSPFDEEEINYSKKTLSDFLNSQNSPSNNFDVIKNSFLDIFSSYKVALINDREHLRSMSKLIHKMSFDAMRLEINQKKECYSKKGVNKHFVNKKSFMQDDKDINKLTLDTKLNQLKENFSTQKIEENLKLLKQLEEKFVSLFNILEKEIKTNVTEAFI